MAQHCHQRKSDVHSQLSSYIYTFVPHCKETSDLFSQQKKGHNSSKLLREKSGSVGEAVNTVYLCSTCLQKAPVLTHDTHSQPERNHLGHDLTLQVEPLVAQGSLPAS